MPSIYETILVYKLETFKNCTEVKHSMINDYGYCCNLLFFILCNILSLVENYFQEILNPPENIVLPSFYSLSPEVHVSPFLPALKIF